MTVSLDGLHPQIMRPRVEALLADPRAISLGITVASAFRSIIRQQQLWDQALVRWHDPEIADNWVARPGTSNHGPILDGYGKAVDLAVNGVHADKDGHWPADVRRQVDTIAADHGLASPMAWEDWHYEPIPNWSTPAPTPVTDDEWWFHMPIFKSEEDKERAFVRDCYLRLLLREPESFEAVEWWRLELHAKGGDAVIAAFADSGEGQDVRAKQRAAIGLT